MICILNWHETSLTWILYHTSQGLIMGFILTFNHIQISFFPVYEDSRIIMYDRQRWIEDSSNLPAAFGSNLISSQQYISWEGRWNIVTMFIFTYSMQLVIQASSLRALCTIQQLLRLPTQISGCSHSRLSLVLALRKLLWLCIKHILIFKKKGKIISWNKPHIHIPCCPDLSIK